MGICPNCGSAGQANRDCATSSSDILWGGGGLCIGLSSGTLDDIITMLSNTICGVVSTLGTVATTDANVTVTSQIGGTCFGADTLLSTWIANAETLLCGLITTVGALDFSEPIDFNNTPVTLTNAVAYTTLDTIVIPANTLNENNEYLEIDIFLSTDAAASANVLTKLTFAGVDAVIWSLMGVLQKTGLRATVRLTRLTSNTLCVDWRGIYTSPKNSPVPCYALCANLTPLDFTISNTILLQGYKNSGTMTVSRTATTKFCKH